MVLTKTRLLKHDFPVHGLRSGGTSERALVPVFRCGEHPNVPSFRIFVAGNIRMYPRSGFRSGGTSAKTTLLETTLLGSSDRQFHPFVLTCHAGCVDTGEAFITYR